MIKIIYISGTMYSGKTSCLDLLKEKYIKNNNIFSYKCLFIKEPLKYWEPFLLDYQNNPNKKTAFRLEYVVYLHYKDIFELIKIAQEEKQEYLIFVERSPMEAIRIFIEKMDKHLGKKQIEFFKNLYLPIINSEMWRSSVGILLSYDCLETLEIRQKQRKETINKDYIMAIRERYNYFNYRYKIITDKLTIIQVNQIVENIIKNVIFN